MIAPTEMFALAIQHYSAREFPRAEQLTLEVLRYNANHAEAWRMLGALAFKRNDPARGFECLNRSLECDGSNPDAWLSLADYFRFAGDPRSAIANYEQALRLRPDFVEAHVGLAKSLRSLKSSRALASYEQAAKFAPDDPEVAFQFADYLREVGQTDRAANGYRQALRGNPGHFMAAAQLGRTLAEQGSIEEAVAQFRHALRLNPNQPNVYYLLSHFAAEGWCELTGEELDRIRIIVASPRCPIGDRGDCAFALGVILQKQGAYDDSMRYYRLGNNLKRQFFVEQKIAFDAGRHDAMVDRIIAAYDSRYFDSVRDWGAATNVPVFIVGMPRSGSTLVEQILANHPQAHGAGEICDVQILMESLQQTPVTDLYSVPMLTSWHLAESLAAAYLDLIRAPNPAASLVSNKTLQNFLHLGMIATLFPRARIIHCRRDPFDVCLSCYFANFNSVPFSCELDDIASYHRSYERLMAHWARVLPTPIHEVRYESLVEQPKPVIQDLISFCGLEWDVRCMESHKSRRVVVTASAAQVRKPIHRKAVGRWQHYREHLGPLFLNLGAPAALPVAAPAATMRTISPEGITGLSGVIK